MLKYCVVHTAMSKHKEVGGGNLAYIVFAQSLMSSKTAAVVILNMSNLTLN